MSRPSRTDRIETLGFDKLMQRDKLGCYAAAMATALTANGIPTTAEQVDKRTNKFGNSLAGQYRRNHAITALGCSAAKLRFIAEESSSWTLDSLRRPKPYSFEEYLKAIRDHHGEQIYETFRKELSEDAYIAFRDTARALEQRNGNRITRIYTPKMPDANTIAGEIARGPVLYQQAVNGFDTHWVVCLEKGPDGKLWSTFDPNGIPRFLTSVSNKEINSKIQQVSHIITVEA